MKWIQSFPCNNTKSLSAKNIIILYGLKCGARGLTMAGEALYPFSSSTVKNLFYFNAHYYVTVKSTDSGNNTKYIICSFIKVYQNLRKY